jgi:hypothetical protein
MCKNKLILFHKMEIIKPMKSINRKILFCINLLIILTVSGCGISIMSGAPTQTATIDLRLVDNSLFTDIPCQAPCWYGLVPGNSTEADSLNTFRELSFLDANRIEKHVASYFDPMVQKNVNAKLITVKCIIPKDHQCVGLIIVGDTLKTIVLFPNYPITFRDALDYLGSPDYVQVIPSLTPGCSLRLVWRERQIILSHTDPNSNTLCEKIRKGARIDPQLMIHSISYVMPTDISLSTIPEAGRDFLWPGFAEP